MDSPSHTSTLAVLTEADTCVRYGNYRRAEQILRDALAASPDNAELRQALADVEARRQLAPSSPTPRSPACPPVFG